MTFPAGRSARLQMRAQRRPRFRRHTGLSAGAATLGALTLILAGCSSDLEGREEKAMVDEILNKPARSEMLLRALSSRSESPPSHFLTVGARKRVTEPGP